MYPYLSALFVVYVVFLTYFAFLFNRSGGKTERLHMFSIVQSKVKKNRN